MNLTKQICHKAAHFDAVAFDVFDTLIKRDVAVPTGLFRLMGDDFYAARSANTASHPGQQQYPAVGRG